MKDQQRENPFAHFADATHDDIQADPRKFGAPTFLEYCLMREKYVGREDDGMIAITDGPRRFRKDLNKIKLQVNGFEATEGQVERMLGDHGYSLADIDLDNRNSRLKKQIQMVPLGGGKFDIVVNFLP